MRPKRLFLAKGIFAILTLALPLPVVAASTYKIIHEFTWAKQPLGNLVRDAAGNLYGMTFEGAGSGCGGSGCGAVYKLAPNPNGTWAASLLHSFKGPDGDSPLFGGLVLDADGNLYGTTLGGGAYGQGLVFRLAPNPNGTWTESVLYSFTGGADGRLPVGVVLDGAGNLYGTTLFADSTACSAGCGVVFKLAPNADGTWEERVLHTFTGTDGRYAYGGLIFDADGNLYGAARLGGTSTVCGSLGCGVVFKLAPNPDGTWTESVLYSFAGGANGIAPTCTLIFDAAGNLYGTTNQGGAYSNGVVFKLAPNPDGTWAESVLYSFGGGDGSSPSAGVTFDAAGNLYGTTQYGGADGYGVVFKLKPTASGWIETVRHSFSGTGKNPTASVIFDSAGNLYGTTSDGSHPCDYGLVFEITP